MECTELESRPTKVSEKSLDMKALFTEAARIDAGMTVEDLSLIHI